MFKKLSIFTFLLLAFSSYLAAQEGVEPHRPRNCSDMSWRALARLNQSYLGRGTLYLLSKTLSIAGAPVKFFGSRLGQGLAEGMAETAKLEAAPLVIKAKELFPAHDNDDAPIQVPDAEANEEVAVQEAPIAGGLEPGGDPNNDNNAVEAVEPRKPAGYLERGLHALNAQLETGRGIQMPEGRKLLGNIASATADAAINAGHRMIENGTAVALLKQGSVVVQRELQDPESLGGTVTTAINSGKNALVAVIQDPETREQAKEVLQQYSGVAIEALRDPESLQGVTDEIKRIAREQTEAVSETIAQKVKRTLPVLVASGVVLAFGTYGCWVLWKQIDRSLSKPKLIIKSSEKSLWQKIKAKFSKQPASKKEIVLAPATKKRLSSIVATTRKITLKIKQGQKNFKYRNVLLIGKPGTGKSMFAELLAAEVGMDYYEMTGASFSQFKNGEGVTEMNKTFEWIRNNPNPMLIFMDEAESFLGARDGIDSQNGSRIDVTEDAYQMLNNFLYHTGVLSNQVMWVFATNHPELLDNAMARRIQAVVELELPGQEERVKILHLYRDKILLDPWQNTPEFIESARTAMNDDVIKDLAAKTKGLSGAELENIVNSIIVEASDAKDGLITPAIIADAVDQEIHKQYSFENKFKKASRGVTAAS